MIRHLERDRLTWNAKMLLLAAIGGALFSFTGLSVGWLVGAIASTGLWQLMQKVRSESPQTSSPFFYPFWKNTAQVVIALQISKHISGAAMKSFVSSWPAIIAMLVLTLIFSLMFGFVFSKWSGTDLKTSLYALTPGGISSIPTISQERGANPVIVTSIHILRMATVSSMIPVFASFCVSSGISPLVTPNNQTFILEPLYETALYEVIEFMHAHPLFWTIVLAFSVWAGVKAAKLMKFPAAILVGGILGVSFMQMAVSSYASFSIIPWLPQSVKIGAQIMLGASLGTKMNRSLFMEARRSMFVGIFSIFGLLAIMSTCSILLHMITGISLVTSLLSFAPGGVAEMAATSNAVHADSSFVIAAQTLRLILIYTFLPILINGILRRFNRKNPV